MIELANSFDSMRQTTNIKHLEVAKKWYLIDAEGQVLGRLAQFVASRLRGKHLPSFTPNVDMGDNIVIINADKVLLTRDKLQNKLYYRHSGYPGGLKVRTAEEQKKVEPTSLLHKAIKGMVPRTKLGRRQLKNLFLYAGKEHKQKAQSPQKLVVNLQ